MAIHSKFDGSVVIVGFGSIGRGFLPLLDRHVALDKSKVTVIDPDDSGRHLVTERGMRFVQLAVTQENYLDVLTPLVSNGGLLIHLSVDVSSVALIEMCKDINALYIDTVIEPWPGFYYDPDLSMSERSNYALRETLIDLRSRRPGGPTAVSACGANPGMVSWLVKQALVDIARDTGHPAAQPTTREGWAELAMSLGVKGIHIAERDTQQPKTPKEMGVFTNTWSVEGFLSEALQPAELAWGTHEKRLPHNGHMHDIGGSAPDLAIYLAQPGASTRIRSWTPTSGPQVAFLQTHSEALSISDYLTVREPGVLYRPTCHYAYHPAECAVLSLNELAGRAWKPQTKSHILGPDDILPGGVDSLGVLLYGHALNAYWFGSTLSIDEAKRLVPNQNATGLQVSSAVLAGIVWMLENPRMGIVEADDMDFQRCLEVQREYLGILHGAYTDWTPLEGRGDDALWTGEPDRDDPWQFSNVLM